MTAAVNNQAQKASTTNYGLNGEHTMPRSNGIAQNVGFIFVREYYTFLSKKPERLHAFYAKDSIYLRGDEGAFVNTYCGQNAIQRKIEELGFEDCKVLVTQVDSQPSADDGIVIQVIGEMLNRNELSQKFCQTFFLARQQNGYHILNDVFRFLREPMNTEYYVYEGELSTPTRQQTPPPPQRQSQPQQQHKGDDMTYTIREDDGDDDNENKATPTLSKDHESVVAKSPEESERVTPKLPSTEGSGTLETAQEDETKAGVTEAHPSITSYVCEMNGMTTARSMKDNEPHDTTQDDKAGLHRSSPKHEPEKKKQQQQQLKQNAAKTWANLAADRSDKWGTQVAETKGGIVTVSGQSLTKSQQQPPSQQPHQAVPALHNQTTTAPIMSSHTQTHSHNNRDQRRGEEATQIFIKGVGQHIQEDHLREAFAQFGAVKAINVVNSRNCAFLDFATSDAVNRALHQHKVNVGNHIVLAEERRHGGGGGGRYQHNRQQQQQQQQQNGRPYERRFQQDGGGHRRGGGAPRGGKSRGGGGGGSGSGQK